MAFSEANREPIRIRRFVVADTLRRTTLIGLLQPFVTRCEKASVTPEIGRDKLTIAGAFSDAERRLVEPVPAFSLGIEIKIC